MHNLQDYHSKNWRRCVWQGQHRASSRPKNSLLSKRHGRIHNIHRMHTCFKGRPLPSKSPELAAHSLKTLKRAGIQTSKVQLRARFQVLQ
jgi:hypothetical protein